MGSLVDSLIIIHTYHKISKVFWLAYLLDCKFLLILLLFRCYANTAFVFDLLKTRAQRCSDTTMHYKDEIIRIKKT
jgi:hypothetical protein